MVQILMSTYNGQEYLREQLDSLFSQNYKDITILVRDDGSTDNTVAILEEYKSRYDQLDYYCGKNVGVIQSFFDLFANRDIHAEYIATCDQDDVWMEDKVEVAVRQLELKKGPALYCGKTLLVDAELHPIEERVPLVPTEHSFGSAMIQNCCTGCTMVINKALADLIQLPVPRACVIHDWWVYLVAVAKGSIIYDETPHIYYRQHGSNEIGLDGSRIGLIKRQVTTLKRFLGTYSAQMEAFLSQYECKPEDEALARLFVESKHSFIKRVRLACNKKVRRYGWFDTLLFRGMLFLGML